MEEQKIIEQINQGSIINPISAILSLTKVGRLFTIIALLIALSIATLYVTINNLNIFNAISMYMTMIFMAWLSIIDYKTYTLPNSILLAWLILRTLMLFFSFAFFGDFETLTFSLIGAFSMGILFLIMYYVSKRSLGGGDVKLSFVLSLSLTTYYSFTAVFLALIICSLYSVIGIWLKKLTRKSHLPLGPFLFAGTLLAYLIAIL
ncbi:MAG: A24 family peptidase [Defluviitaleaceae bacterium]|nr:A24 family peptidase [Defluviitaleaceae bacterium]